MAVGSDLKSDHAFELTKIKRPEKHGKMSEGVVVVSPEPNKVSTDVSHDTAFVAKL